MRIFLTVLLAVSTLAAAQDARILAHVGCPVKFTVPDDWSGDSTNRCEFQFTKDKQKINVRVYSGSLADAEMLYWRASESDDEYQSITIGEYTGIHRDEPRMYVISNGDLVAVANSDQDDVPNESFKTLLRPMRFTAKSRKGDRQHHPVLFDRKCGVGADYPDDLIAKPGKKPCSVELYAAWPPPATGYNRVAVSDSFPDEWCISDSPGDFPPEVQTVKDPKWTLFKEGGSARGYGLAGYQGMRDFETWIFTDGCRTLSITEPSDRLRESLMKTVRFSPSECEQRITKVPKCND